ncbi:hypothetical protein RH831_06370 [Halodesulfurarchaeum sp. HSR-GB]|uniref:hypothetical protein n=1 Tax=Halodesulfurarchaeum sp. HSR-GB TaxID=3074077 RepID=UPI00285B44F5|nr:hypothetical protein [Halodesulfurarchaeum sp. HSR-GB]MDR5656803.1 hypothetical protein [Halodesulfurarchaeum sp. HSR-GB]
MERTRSLRWAGRYFLYTTGLGLLGLLLVGLGGYLAYSGLMLGPETIYGVPYPHVTSTSFFGIVPVVLGVVVWRAGKAWALYHTLSGAVSEELGDTYDTEHVKSDIVAVLDDRLADMQQDLQSVNREVRDLKEAEEFEFNTAD